MSDDEHRGQAATGPAQVPAFDDLLGEVLPGSSVVARAAGIVLVVRPKDSAAGGGEDADRTVAELLDLVRDASARGTPAPGRDLARVLTEFVVRARAVPDFGTVAATEDGIAVFLRGDVSVAELAAPDASGRPVGELLSLSGSTAAFTVDRLLPRPRGPIVLSVGPVRDRASSPAAVPGWSGLVRGLVPGDGIVLSRPAVPTTPTPDRSPRHRAATEQPLPAEPTPGARPAASDPTEEHSAVRPDGRGAPAAEHSPPAAPAPAAPPPPASPPAAPSPPSATPTPTAPPPPAAPTPPAVPAPPPPPPDAPVPVLRPPKVSDLIHQSKAHEARRPPLPVAGGRAPAPRPGAPAGPAHVVVKGFRCSRNHHNDPRVSFCSVCGIRMDQRTGVLVDGRRPPLGLLVLDIGATFVLDDNYLLGRNPEVDEAVVHSQLRPIRLDDDSGTLSRVHAEIRLEGWDVLLIDRGSANGSFIAAAGQSGWTRLQPQQPVVLAPGMHVRIGRRTFTFESAHARI